MTLREMWREAVRRKHLIWGVLLLSSVVGVLVAYNPGVPPESRQYTVWLSSADILVDTADSQVVDSKGPDFLSLANRTSLLGNLIATEPLRTAIADTAGVKADTLVVVPPANTTTSAAGGVPLTPTPVTTAASREVPDSEATVLTVSTDANLPILRVTAQAPDAATASGLTAATATALARHLKTVGARQEIPAPRKLVLRPLAAPTPAPDTRGTPRTLGVLVAIVLALLGCGAIVTAPMIARRWRRAAEAANRQAEVAASREVEDGPDPSAPITAEAGSNGSHEGVNAAEAESNGSLDEADDGRHGSPAIAELAAIATAREQAAPLDPADAPAHRTEQPAPRHEGAERRRDQIRAGDA